MYAKYPIDYRKGIEDFGGDEEKFKGAVEQFEIVALNEAIDKLYDGIKQKNWLSVRKEAHALKSTSNYIHAVKFSESALNLQKAVERHIDKEINEYFYQFLTEAKALKHGIARLTEKQFNNSKIDKYIKEFQIERKTIVLQKHENNQPCCKSCRIF